MVGNSALVKKDINVWLGQFQGYLAQKIREHFGKVYAVPYEYIVDSPFALPRVRAKEAAIRSFVESLGYGIEIAHVSPRKIVITVKLKGTTT